MARPLEIERHPRRAEIDFAIGNDASLSAIARTFDLDRATVTTYARRMVADDSRYFARLNHPAARAVSKSPVLFVLAEQFARHRREAFLRQAEAAFAPSNP